MRSTNLLILRGHVGQDPKAFGDTCKVSVATTRNWKDNKGERHNETDWVTVTILNKKIAAWVTENVKKGDPIYCECRVRNTSYKKDGETVYTTDVIANLFDSLVPKPEGSDDEDN